MSREDDIAAALPPAPGSCEEPPSLRSDIVDELADHLRLAARREELRDPAADDAKVRAAVLNRFGDPRKVARELYFDAMKERIMKDRILIGLMVVMILTILAVAGLAYLSFQQNQQMMQAVLAKLEASPPPAAAAPVDVSERGIIEVTVVDEQGKPREGINLQLHGAPVRESQLHSMTRATDEQGKVVFHKLLPGSYQLTMGNDSDAKRRYKVSFRRQLLLLPGDHLVEQLIQPEFPPLVPVTLRITGVPRLIGKPDALALQDEYERPSRFGPEWIIGPLVSPLVLLSHEEQEDAGAAVSDTSVRNVQQDVQLIAGSWQIHGISVATKVYGGGFSPEGEYMLRAEAHLATPRHFDVDKPMMIELPFPEGLAEKWAAEHARAEAYRKRSENRPGIPSRGLAK